MHIEGTVLLFTIDAGSGHRAAAKALASAVDELGPPWRLRVESLQQILRAHDLVKRFTGHTLEEGYNLVLQRGLAFTMEPILRFLQSVLRVYQRSMVPVLAAWLREQPRPAAVVSVMPNFNGVIRDALRIAWPGVPFIVVLTDFADIPPRFWIVPGIDRVVVGTDRARAQALELGIPAASISLVSGMIMNPRFYRVGQSASRERVRADLGLEPSAFVVTLLFGGKGSPEMVPIAQRLLDADPALRVIAICGDNPGLFERFSPLASRLDGRLVRVGFTDRVAEFLAASDVLVTKPGPGSLSEAFHVRVPVVVLRNMHTIPQERFNTDFVRQQGLGLVLRSWRAIPEAVHRLHLDPALRTSCQARLAALPENRAVYEIVEILAREVRGGAASVTDSPARGGPPP